MPDYYHSLSQQFPEIKFQPQLSLAQRTYFKIGGPAEVFVSLDQAEQIAQVYSFCHQQNIPVTIWGGASNVIVADAGISGLVLEIAANQVSELNHQVDNKHLVQAEAGIKTALLVRQTIDMGYQGLEYFLGVPGSLGGAVYNNAHYLQDLIGSHIHQVQVIAPDGKITWLSHDACDFAYDHSRFHTSSEIIFAVQFALKPGSKEASMAKVKEATQYRANTQPLGQPSSGCIFQNVPNSDHLRELFPQFADKPFVPGGFLIDQAGLKNTQVGGVEVSDKHAAFFVNTGNGTAKDVAQLISLVKSTVKTNFGVDLHEEVFFLGNRN